MGDSTRDFVFTFWPYLALAGLIVVAFVAILVVGAWEKHPLHDFAPAPDQVLWETSGYFTAMNQAAQRLGLGFHGAFAQARGKTYQCRMALWLPPSGDCLIAVFGGKIAGANYRRTFIYSWLGEQSILVTMDEFGSVDLGGVWQAETLINADLPELYERHRQRLNLAGGASHVFTADAPLAQYETMTRIRVDRMIARGLAGFVDQNEEVWKYTLKGAWGYAIQGYLKGLKNAQGQAARMKKKRPGS